jgi:hypothetical protein
MFWHSQLGNTNFAKKRMLYMLVSTKQVSLGGYSKGKIYGTLLLFG